MTDNATFSAVAARPNVAISAYSGAVAHFAASAPRPAMGVEAVSGATARFSAMAARPSAAITFRAPTGSPPARASVPQDSTNGRQHRRQIAQAVNSIRKGQIDCTATLTLTPNATQTVLTDARVSTWTHASFAPATASAANALPGMWWTVSNGVLTANHAASTATDQTFSISLLG